MEKFAAMFDVPVAELLRWESEKDFVESVRDNDAPWVFKRRLVMQALLARARDITGKEQLLYSAAYLIAIGDNAGHELAKLVK
jgi:hypothetical protein